MGFLDKIKNVFFEEEDEEIENEKVKINDNRDEIAVKIEEEEKKEIEPRIKTSSIVFDEEDFIETKEEIEEEKPLYTGSIYKEKEESKLYSGSVNKEKQKFKPSPVISPVYGVVQDIKEDSLSKTKSLDALFSSDIKKKMTLDTVRQKAYGDTDEFKTVTDVSSEYDYEDIDEGIDEEESEKSLLYDMESEENPVIEKVTIGDAEEYFQDLGLEYNVDYKDGSKEKQKKTQSKTRVAKNKDLSENIMKEEKEDDEYDDNTTSLYDLIDMMYKEKE